MPSYNIVIERMDHRIHARFVKEIAGDKPSQVTSNLRLNPEKIELLSVIFVEGKLNMNFILASIKLSHSECTGVELLA